ncbi:MAG: hypothetical protein ACYSWU_05575 [Planctomycetota bacterium]|jgi:hypothetical protein
MDQVKALARKGALRSPAEKIKDASETVDKMLAALRSRDAAEPDAAHRGLEDLQTQLRGLGLSVTPAMAKRAVGRLYSLLVAHPALDRLYYRISYSATIESVSQQLRALGDLSRERELSADELLRMQRLRKFLAALEECLRETVEDEPLGGSSLDT